MNHIGVLIGVIEKPQKCIFDEKQGYDARFRAEAKSCELNCKSPSGVGRIMDPSELNDPQLTCKNHRFLP
jgi:hypothetical protein